MERQPQEQRPHRRQSQEQQPKQKEQATVNPRPYRVVLNGGPLTFSMLDEAWERPLRVKIGEHELDRLKATAAIVQRIAAGSVPVYGINTGFGHLCRKRIPPNEVEHLQQNLILSHAVGVGPAMPAELVRWMMLFKLQGLCLGYSGVSLETIQCLASLLSADVLPVVPTQGSLGASGDLAPLAHMVLPMIGLGEVFYKGRVCPAQEVLSKVGIAPIALGPKEGLGLINGTQFMSAYAAAAVVRARWLLKQADLIATMSLEGLLGSVKPFSKRLHELRPHTGAIETAENVCRMMVESETLASHAQCNRVQDPYSLRCVPQVHGASRDAVRHAAAVVEIEINSVTDNPVVFEDGTVISGGLFHGEPLALVLDYLAMALAEIASISERRTYLLLSGVEGLPISLMRDTGLNSGFMLPQYTSAALVSENKGLCTPACVDSIPTSLGQEDHVSMGARAAVKCRQVLENTEIVLAIEMMCAAQALDYREPLKPGIGPRVAHEEIRKHIVHAEEDRLFSRDIQASRDLIRSLDVLRAVENVIGPLK